MSSLSVPAADCGCAPVACFFVHARSDPGVMPRVLELFAKRGLVPRKCHGDTSGPSDAALTIDLQIGGLDPDTVAYVANCMRQIAGVETVLTAAA
jgi:hypothetical protein